MSGSGQEKSDGKPAWVLDTWYVACTPDEIASKPLGRKVCGQSMVIFRNAAGAVTALEDFCPHRGALLSLGVVCGETIVCGYHGLAVDCAGRPSAMPGQRVSRFPSVRVFPVVERYGFVWVWPGDAARADPATLHHFAWAEDPGWAYGGGLFHVRCDYRLMIDNLMDLTHETYVHATSIGQKEIDEAPVDTRLEGEEVVTSRHMHAIAAPPFWRMALRCAGLPEDADVDRWQVCRFSLPSHVMIEVGVALAGQGGRDADPGARAASVVVDFMTPETDTSHWYFWGMARNFAVDDPAVTQSIREGQSRIFTEDLEMLQKQQANLLQNPERQLLVLNIDAGGAHARRLIQRAVAHEHAQASPAAA